MISDSIISDIISISGYKDVFLDTSILHGYIHCDAYFSNTKASCRFLFLL